jgi:hypothetical protein
MCGWIMIAHHTIMASTNDLTIKHNNGPNRHFSGRLRNQRFLECGAHKLLILNPLPLGVRIF